MTNINSGPSGSSVIGLPALCCPSVRASHWRGRNIWTLVYCCSGQTQQNTHTHASHLVFQTLLVNRIVVSLSRWRCCFQVWWRSWSTCPSTGSLETPQLSRILEYSSFLIFFMVIKTNQEGFRCFLFEAFTGLCIWWDHWVFFEELSGLDKMVSEFIEGIFGLLVEVSGRIEGFRSVLSRLGLLEVVSGVPGSFLKDPGGV